MVSKNSTRAVFKTSVHGLRVRHRDTKNSAHKSSPSPLKSIGATINRFVGSCRRLLVMAFARLSVPGAADHHLRFIPSQPTQTKRHCWQPPQRPSIVFLPLLTYPPVKKTVFLDLDETLIHSTIGHAPQRYDFIVHHRINGRVVPFYVLKRPGADELIRAAARFFEVVVITAGLREYASPILDRLDRCGEFISQRLYRDACKITAGRFVKDLSSVGRALDRVVLVDDNPNSYLLQPENAFPVAPFTDNLGDQELRRVMDFLEVARHCHDMREALAHYRSMYEKKNRYM